MFVLLVEAVKALPICLGTHHDAHDTHLQRRDGDQRCGNQGHHQVVPEPGSQLPRSQYNNYDHYHFEACVRHI